MSADIKYEKVYGELEWYDGVRKGIADTMVNLIDLFLNIKTTKKTTTRTYTVYGQSANRNWH